MAGLVPAISIRETHHMREFYVYILASRPGGALYVGVTNSLVRRVFEHRNKMVDGHTKRYGIDRLVYFEIYETAYQAIQREKTSNICRGFTRRGLSQRKMAPGVICMMKLQGIRPIVGIAGTSPAMTRWVLATILNTLREPESPPYPVVAFGDDRPLPARGERNG